MDYHKDGMGGVGDNTGWVITDHRVGVGWGGVLIMHGKVGLSG